MSSSNKLSSSFIDASFQLANFISEGVILLESLRNKHTEELDKQSIKNTILQLEKYKETYLKTKISLVVVGSTCSGKTTLINALINTIINHNDGDNIIHKKTEDEEEWQEYLPSNSQENTITYTFINRVPEDKKFHQGKINVCCDNGPIETKENNIELCDYLQNIEKNNKHILIKNEHSQIINLPKINIYLPKFEKEIQIIDTPGISTTSFLEELKLIVQEGVCIFLYVKNLESEEINHANVHNFFQVTSEFYGRGNYQYWMVFTKEDLYSGKYEPSKYETKNQIEKKQREKEENFNKFLENTESEIKIFKIRLNKIFNISTMICFMPGHPDCKKMKNKINTLFESIMEFRNNEGDYYIKFSYLDRIEKLIDNLNKKLNETNQIDLKTVLFIKSRAEMEIDVFNTMIINLLESKMFKSANEYAICKPEEFKTCEDIIQKAIKKKDIRKETFFIKEKYVNRILEETSKDIHRIIIQKELTDIFRIRFEDFQLFLSQKIKIERLHTILGLDFSMIENEKLDLTKLILSGLDQKFNDFDYDIKNVNLLELANNLFNPGYREFYITYIVIKSLRLDHYIEIFPHQIDNNEFISIVLKHIMDNKDSIITGSVDQFRQFLYNGIVKKIENAREMNEEIGDIDKKIRRYRTSECILRSNNPETSYKTIYEKIDREEFIFLDPELLKLFEKFIDSRI